MSTPELKFGDRRKLPARRYGINQKIVILDGKRRVVLHLRTSEYTDGTLGEIFCTVAQNMDSSLGALIDIWCIAVSLALQHGCPLETLVELYTFTKFSPAGPVKNHDRLRMCSSIADAVMRDLAIAYLGRDDLAHAPKQTDEKDGDL